ncbi:hypothetical protein NCCP1664_24340 [Zafaria cholistanensis]|uniref:Uncharacterized protein n=1 Tax=Zafaria cholistanensis TaxID=1682741 RepID=A0A5A7NT80_9MICC|nr:hypothetical protein [Zafaria cholistanensis]GER23939.1 hypothetical protein NCCP1664_24340 [Zafaria cholistanensis]
MNSPKESSPLRRIVLVSTATVALASLLSLAAILAFYVAGATPWTGLFAVGLWGLPLAFLLLLVLLAMSWQERRRA